MKYNTVIDVINGGKDPEDAVKRVNGMIDLSRTDADTDIIFGPTSGHSTATGRRDVFHTYNRREKKFRTRLYIICDAEDMSEATYKANSIFDIRNMEDRSSVIWEGSYQL